MTGDEFPGCVSCQKLVPDNTQYAIKYGEKPQGQNRDDVQYCSAQCCYRHIKAGFPKVKS